MAKNQPSIQVIAYVHVGDQLVNVDELSPKQREHLGCELTVTMLNAAFKGQARFWY